MHEALIELASGQLIKASPPQLLSTGASYTSVIVNEDKQHLDNYEYIHRIRLVKRYHLLRSKIRVIRKALLSAAIELTPCREISSIFRVLRDTLLEERTRAPIRLESRLEILIAFSIYCHLQL